MPERVDGLPRHGLYRATARRIHGAAGPLVLRRCALGRSAAGVPAAGDDDRQVRVRARAHRERQALRARPAGRRRDRAAVVTPPHRVGGTPEAARARVGAHLRRLVRLLLRGGGRGRRLLLLRLVAGGHLAVVPEPGLDHGELHSVAPAVAVGAAGHRDAGEEEAPRRVMILLGDERVAAEEVLQLRLGDERRELRSPHAPICTSNQSIKHACLFKSQPTLAISSS